MKNGAGYFSKQIRVFTNDPLNSAKLLTIKGIINPSLEWSPIDFKVSTAGNSDIPEITIRSLNNKSFSVKNFSSTSDAFTAKFDPNIQALEFTLKPEVDLEKLKTIQTNGGLISIQLDHPDYLIISLPFQLIKPLQVSPSQIVILKAKKGESREITFELHANGASGDENIFEQIESITASEGTKVKMLKHTNLAKACKVDLKITPSEKVIKNSESSLRVEVVINMKNGSRLNIPVRFYYE